MLLVSHDSKYLFSTNGSRLDVFSIASGDLVYRLSYNETGKTSKKSGKSKSNQNESIIKSICINTTNKYQLLSFHLGGRICLWDYEDGLLLKTFETKLTIKKIIRTETNLYAIGKLRNDFMDKNTNSNKEIIESQQLCLYKLIIDDNVKSQSQIEHQLVISNLNLNEDKLLVAIDNEAKYIAYVEGRKHLVVNQFKKNNNNLVSRFKAKLEITCLAIHPNEDCIATGTKSGKIILWYNYLQNGDEPMTVDNAVSEQIKATKSVLHWHSLPVLSLCFTPEGSYLLSGGHECVLVKWMYRTGQTEFKPRLGAPIDDIVLSRDNTLYASHHLDNTIHLIGTNLNVQQTFCGFLSPNFSNNSKSVETFYPTGLNYFKELNCLVTNGKPGHLQFYSYSSDKLLFNLDIVEENYISPENLNRPNVHTEIECMAFNYDSTWLATIERRDDLVTTSETRLKFWQFDRTNNKFSLNTLVRFPHGFEAVNKIKFKPDENIVFTCGNDGCFKSWVLKENRMVASNHTNEVTYNWIYNSCDGYRDLIPSNIEFMTINESIDLVSVSFNHITTIWQYDQYGLMFLNDLIHCDPSDHIKEMKLIGNNLLVSHFNFLNVWSITVPKKALSDVTLENKIKFICTWSHETTEVLNITENPTKPCELILFIKKMQKQINEETSTEIQAALFNIDDAEPSLKVIQTFNVYSDSRIHFVCVKKSQADGAAATDEKKKTDFDCLLEKINIFYCDNRGILQKVQSKNKILVQNKADESEQAEFIDVELDDSMFNNRKSLKKNLPETNLTSIIELHKSNKWNKDNQFIESQKNALFDSNLSKIETTPAYLLPKVSSFCYDLLKSMLHRFDEPTESKPVKKTPNGTQLEAESVSELSSDEEAMELDEKIKENTSKQIAV